MVKPSELPPVMAKKLTDRGTAPFRKKDGMCLWFLMCRNDAVGVVEHPILGEVPACQRCVDTLDLELKHS